MILRPKHGLPDAYFTGFTCIGFSLISDNLFSKPWPSLSRFLNHFPSTSRVNRLRDRQTSKAMPLRKLWSTFSSHISPGQEKLSHHTNSGDNLENTQNILKVESYLKQRSVIQGEPCPKSKLAFLNCSSWWQTLLDGEKKVGTKIYLSKKNKVYVYFIYSKPRFFFKKNENITCCHCLNALFILVDYFFYCKTKQKCTYIGPYASLGSGWASGEARRLTSRRSGGHCGTAPSPAP